MTANALAGMLAPTRGLPERWVWLVVPAVLALAGCEALPGTLPVDDPGVAWAAHEERLRELETWSAVGRVAVKAPQDSFTARLVWDQDADRFHIRLSGPLGQGAAELQGRPGAVELRTARDELHRAANPEALLRSHTGWRVPLAGLRFWVLGRPRPGIPIDAMDLDPGGRLSRLDQSGWRIEYAAYQDVEGLALPARLEFSNARFRGRLVVSRWDL